MSSYIFFRYPFSSYKQVFVDSSYVDIASYSTLSIFSLSHMHSSAVSSLWKQINFSYVSFRLIFTMKIFSDISSINMLFTSDAISWLDDKLEFRFDPFTYKNFTSYFMNGIWDENFWSFKSPLWQLPLYHLLHEQHIQVLKVRAGIIQNYLFINIIF